MIARYASLWTLQLMLVSIALSGCSSTATRGETLAVKIAKQEMRHLGWKRFEVGRCVLRDGLWIVDFYRPRSGVNFASVKVSPDGTVVDVFVNQK
jgi:hypothetical protein